MVVRLTSSVATVVDILILLAVTSQVHSQNSSDPLQPAGLNLTSYPIKWVQGVPYKGNFTYAKGLALSSNDTYHSFLADKSCTCTSACWAHPTCVGVSSETTAYGKVLCRLTKKSPIDSNLMRSNGAVYIFRTSSIRSIYYGIGLDGLLYVIPNEHYLVSYAKEVCARIPGHRLGMFHTAEQFKALMNIHQITGINLQLTIDVKDIAKTDLQWGDGTNASATSAWSDILAAWNKTGADNLLSMIVTGNQLYDAHGWWGGNFAVCQANPFGKTW